MEHEGTLRLGVFIDLFNDFLFVLLAFLWVALSDRRAFIAPLAYLGLGISNAVLVVVFGIMFAIPELARLPQGETVAQGAAVLQWTIEGSLRPAALALGLAVVGYLMMRSRSVPAGFGLALVLLMAAVLLGLPAWGTPLWNLSPLAGVVGLKLWTLAISVVLLVQPSPVVQSQARQPQFQPRASEQSGS